MRFNVYINQEKAKNLGITLNQCALLSLFTELSSWAQETVIDGRVYYFISRNKVISELPLFFKKPDTVYRNFKKLCDLELVDYLKKNGKDYVRLSAKGKQYNKLGFKSENTPNSDLVPSKLGFESEFQNDVNVNDYQLFTFGNSDSNPTYNNNYTKDNSLREDLTRLKKENLVVFESFLNAPTFYENIMRQLTRKDKKIKFQKDIVPIYLKWLINKLDAGALDKNVSALKSMCLSYITTVIENKVVKSVELNGSNNMADALLKKVV